MQQPLITLFCPFTRRWALDTWIDNLRSCRGIEPALTNLAFIVDCDEPYIVGELQKMSKADGYRSCHIIMNENNSPNEVHIAVRRRRIVDVKEQSKELISKTDGRLVLGLEDDTIFGDVDFSRLWLPFADEKIGFVEGVACGRWGVKIIGAWVADQHPEPTKIQTIDLPDRSVTNRQYSPITAGGFYGYVTRVEEYLAHTYHWDDSQPWGPDVNYGLWLKSLGYTNLIDWATGFGHNDHNRVISPDGDIACVSYTKYSDGGWKRTDTEKENWR